MTSGQVQRYKLTGNDQIKVTNQTGGTPVLEIGNYQFELPKDNLNQFANQWNQAGSQIQMLSSQSSGGSHQG